MAVILAGLSFLLPLMAIMGSIKYYFETRRALICSLIIALAFSAIASGIVNIGLGDLDRYIELLDQYRSVTLQDAFSLKYGSLPLTTLWFWLVAKLGAPFMLQSSEAFVNYFIIAYIIFDYAKRNKLSNRRTIIALLICFIFFPMYFTVQSLRSTPALLIGILGIYLDVFRDSIRKLPAWLLMILPLFIHPVGFTIILLRVLLYIFGFGRGRTVASLIAIFVIPIILGFSSLLSPLTSAFNYNVIDILTRYSEWTSGYATRVSGSTFQNLLRGAHGVMLIIVLIDCVIINKPHSDTDKSLSMLQSIVILMASIELSFIVFVTVPSYLRFSYPLAPFLSIYIASRVGAIVRRKDYRSYYEQRLLAKASLWDSVVIALSVIVFALNRLYTILAVKSDALVFSILFGYLGQLLR